MVDLLEIREIDRQRKGQVESSLIRAYINIWSLAIETEHTSDIGPEDFTLGTPVLEASRWSNTGSSHVASYGRECVAPLEPFFLQDYT